MQKAIQAIIDEVPKGCIFDSHFVINELIKRFSDEYFEFVGKFATNSPNVTLTAHGQIGQEINKHDVINDNYFFPLTTIRIPVCHNL